MMEEAQPTGTSHLDDGSEYSPDGIDIYINSTRSGTMQIWRMVADGNGPTRPTFDVNFNDWVADLDRGHTQHINHNPPWQLRPWVVTKEGRSSKPGEPLDCKTCDR